MKVHRAIALVPTLLVVSSGGAEVKGGSSKQGDDDHDPRRMESTVASAQVQTDVTKLGERAGWSRMSTATSRLYAQGMRSGRTILMVTALVAIASTAGCSSDADKPAEPKTSSAASSTPSPAAADALTPDNFGTVVGAAVVASGSTQAELTADSDGQNVKAKAEIATRAAGSMIAATVDFGPSVPDKTQLRLIGDALYLNLGAASGDRFAGVPYPPTGKYKVALPYVQILGELDPVAKIGLFAKMPESVTPSTKPVTIDGVEAKAYVLSFEQGGRKIKVTAYVGPDNLPRRVTSEAGGGKVTVNFTNWGRPVDVAEPPTS